MAVELCSTSCTKLLVLCIMYSCASGGIGCKHAAKNGTKLSILSYFGGADKFISGSASKIASTSFSKTATYAFSLMLVLHLLSQFSSCRSSSTSFILLTFLKYEHKILII